MVVRPKPGFFWGLGSGLILGLALAATVAFAANIGVFDRGPARVHVYQNDSNPNLYYYDVYLKDSNLATHTLAVTGNWSRSVRVEAQPK